MENVLVLIWFHFIADFLLQTNEMAIKKSSSFYWLTVHAFVYSLIFVMFGWKFMLVNGVAHWCVDCVTSKVNASLWEAEKTGLFFKSIGFDQAIHITTLVVTAELMLK